MFLLVKLHIDMGLEAVLPGPQNALYVMLCYVKPQANKQTLHCCTYFLVITKVLIIYWFWLISIL